MPGGEISFAGAGGSGTESLSLRRQMTESEGKDASTLDSKRERQFEDVVESKETNGGCTDEENMVTIKLCRGAWKSRLTLPNLGVRHPYLVHDIIDGI